MIEIKDERLFVGSEIKPINDIAVAKKTEQGTVEFLDGFTQKGKEVNCKFEELCSKLEAEGYDNFFLLKDSLINLDLVSEIFGTVSKLKEVKGWYYTGFVLPNWEYTVPAESQAEVDKVFEVLEPKFNAIQEKKHGIKN